MIAERRSGEAANANGFIGFGSCIGPVYGRFLGVVSSLVAGEGGCWRAAFDAVRLSVLDGCDRSEGPACRDTSSLSSSSFSRYSEYRPLDCRRVGGVGVVGNSLGAMTLGVARLVCDADDETTCELDSRPA